MNIKKLVSIIFLVLISFVFVPKSFAQSELMFGQKHFYTVVFRGNGEAVVYAKLVVNNPNNASLSQMTIDIPRVNPNELTIFQQKLAPKCNRYDYGTYSNNYQKSCLEYGEPDYDTYYYDSYNNNGADYQKIEFYQTGSMYNFELPYSIPPYKSGAVIVSYIAKGYVTQALGLYKFNFETIKVPSRISDIRVAVDVDSDLILKGKKSQVNYENNYSMGMAAQQTSLAFKSPSLDKFVSNIGSSGPLIKEAKNLSPNESFSVKGEYSTSWLRLYFGSIVLFLLSVIFVFVLIYYISKFFNKNKNILNDLHKKVTQTPQIPRPDINKDKVVAQIAISNSTLFIFLMGFVSCLSVITLTFLLNLLSKILISINMYNYFPYNSFMSMVIPIVMFIMLIIMYFFAVLGPAIYAANRVQTKGWKTFLYVLLAEFIWFVVLLLLLVIFFSGNRSTPPYNPQPVYF